MKKKVFSMLALLVAATTGAWAQDPIDLTYDAQTDKWTLASMPAYDVELEVEYETELALSETTDNSAALTEWDGYEADVTLTRTLKAGSWNTFVVPFGVDATKLAALKALKGVTVKELSSASFDAGTLTLTFADATSIEAGKPYLVKVTTDFDLSTNTFPGAIVNKTPVPFTSSAVDFIPTLGKTTIPAGETKEILFLASGNKLMNPTELPADMKGFRAYFQLKGDAVNAASFNLDLGEGETTGIDATLVNSEKVNSVVYDLQGRKVAQPTKGLYIVNGKKVVIK